MKRHLAVGLAGALALIAGLQAQVASAQSIREEADDAVRQFNRGDVAAAKRFCDRIRNNAGQLRPGDPDGVNYALRVCIRLFPPVTPPKGGGSTSAGGTSTSTGGGTTTGTGTTTGPLSPPPVKQPHIPGLLPPPPQPDMTVPRHFCSLQEKIDYIQQVLSLRSRWWKYADDIRELAWRQHLDSSAVTAAIQAADKVYFDMGDLVRRLYDVPVIDCGHAGSSTGYIVPGNPLPGTTGTGIVVTADSTEYAGGTTTFTTPADKLTVRYHTEQIALGGMVYAGPAFAALNATIGVNPKGDSNDVFTAGGAFASNVNTGKTASLNAIVGYDLLQTPTTTFGVLGGYYGSYESLYGSVPGGATEFAIMTDTWNAGQAGAFVKQSFTLGSVPLQFWGSVTGLWDHLHSGAFAGDGGGVKANAALSFPIGIFMGRITGQYADMNASGSVLGVSQRVNAQNWFVGAGISLSFGAGSMPSAPAFPLKAPWMK